MTDHDPRAAEVLANVPLLQGWDRYRTLGPRRADELLDALTAAGLAVIETGSVPPWMEPPQHLMDHDLTAIWYGDNDELIWTEAPREAWESIARPLYVIKEDD